jgi:hypothetical protein
MQRPCFIPALAALALALALPAVARAAPVVNGAPTFHDRFEEDFVDDDFCGTGASVSVHMEGRLTVWEREGAFKEVSNETFSFTHDGMTLVSRVSGRVVAVDVRAQGGAARTVEVVETGLRGTLKVADGGVLTKNRGLLHYFMSFDEDGEVVGFEIVRDRGGHPGFQSDVFCEVTTAAFGLPFPG